MATSSQARHAACGEESLADLLRVAEYQKAATTLANLFQIYGDLLPEGLLADFALALEALLAVPLLPGEIPEVRLRRQLGGMLELAYLPPQ